MTLTLFVFCALAIIATAIGIALSYRRLQSKVGSGWKKVDLPAMARLFSSEDDRFLSENVPWYVLIHLRFKRAIAAEDYLARLRDNSRYAVAVGRAQNNPALLEAATAMRIELIKLQWKAWVGVVAPINADLSRLNALTYVFSNGKLALLPTR
jgi:hypothetical protein